MPTTTFTATSTSTSSATQAQQYADEMQRITDAYQQAIGTPTPAIQKAALDALAIGVDVRYILYAINETGRAPRPSWRYTMAIIGRLMRERPDPKTLCVTMSEALLDQMLNPIYPVQ